MPGIIVANEFPQGCGNHGCRRVEPKGLATNGPCRCTQTELAFVGEAPGQEEIENGRPFVGSAGRTLDAMLRTAGINRTECFVGNIFQIKLDNNDLGATRQRLGGDQWAALETASLAVLAADLAKCKPRLIVALGETAFLYLTRLPFNVGSVRGSVQRTLPEFGGGPVLVTYHPSYVQRVWKMFGTVTIDLMRAKTLAKTGLRPAPKRTLLLMPTIEEVEAYLLGPCLTTDLLSVDIETGWGMVRSIQFAPNQYEAMCVPFIARKEGFNYWDTLEQEMRAWKAIRTVFEHPVPKLGQNFGGYDIQWLAEKMGLYVKGFRDDLMLLHKTMYPELPAGLAFMAGSYSEQGPWKAALKERLDKQEE